MFEVFEKYLTDQAPITSRQVQKICDHCEEKTIARHGFVLCEGEISPTCFVTKGLLRLYRKDAELNERILKFSRENGWISDRKSYLNGTPSACNICAVEDSKILLWKKHDFDNLLNELPAFRQLMRDLSAKSQTAEQERLYNSISLSAEEKYLDFINKQPAICNRVPLHMVAAYLGLSRETLSRVRRRRVSRQ